MANGRFEAQPLAERFWSHVDKNGPTLRPELGPCWIWTSDRNTRRGGYGVIRVGGKKRQAHRVAWELEHGPLPAGAILLHRCDNPPCVRHTFPGTRKENNADAKAKGRTCRGAGRPNAKLTDAAVQDLRARAARGERNRDLCRAFGICPASVSAIVARRTWQHVA